MAAGSGDDVFVEFSRVQKSYDGETLVVKDLNLAASFSPCSARRVREKPPA
jgi:hypothetical protein